ncbi:MAG TPA: HPr family phosphocarrier protein [Capillibacterium sp.]
MYQKTTVIKNRTGLHARPASEFIACAKKFKSNILIGRTNEEEKVNAKSIVLLLSLGIGQGESVAICAEGEDEVEAVDTLVALIEAGFNE